MSTKRDCFIKIIVFLLTYKGEACTGDKPSKDRITVLVGANMDGTEKLKLLVIEKSNKPRYFNGIRALL